MRKPVLVSLGLFTLALSSFALGGHRKDELSSGLDVQGTTGPNVIREIVLPDSRVPPSYRFVNFLGFIFLGASVISLAADHHNRKKEIY